RALKLCGRLMLERVDGLFIAIDDGSLEVDLVLIEAPVTALIGFIAIQAAAPDPFPIFEASFIHRSEAGLGRSINGAEGYAKALACAYKLTRSCSHEKTKAFFGVGTEDFIEADLYPKAVKKKRDRRMTLIEHKAVDIAFGLMFNQKRAELLEHTIALAKIVFGIVPGIDTEWREADCGTLAEGVERVGPTRRAAIRLRNKEW